MERLDITFTFLHIGLQGTIDLAFYLPLPTYLIHTPSADCPALIVFCTFMLTVELAGRSTIPCQAHIAPLGNTYKDITIFTFLQSQTFCKLNDRIKVKVVKILKRKLSPTPRSPDVC